MNQAEPPEELQNLYFRNKKRLNVRGPRFRLHAFRPLHRNVLYFLSSVNTTMYQEELIQCQ